MAKPRYYDWQATMSRQTGTQGEHCLVIGGKDIGKTFGLRLRCVEIFTKRREKFCEVFRTKAEKEQCAKGYFDKLTGDGFFKDYIFKSDKECGYIALRPACEDDKPDWQLCCYFVALTELQTAKKRTYDHPTRFIFDEALIDRDASRYARYLPNEFLILGKLLDSVSRQQPDGYQYRVYYIGNSVDITCPYLRYLGIDKVPEAYGYYWYKNRTVLLHYVEPWDVHERECRTLVGRMLAGMEGAETVFANRFTDTTGREVMHKTPQATFSFGIIWHRQSFGVWVDKGAALWFISPKIPKGAKRVYTLTKRDGTAYYDRIDKAHPACVTLMSMYQGGVLRYESSYIREAFLEVLGFMGIR